MQNAISVEEFKRRGFGGYSARTISRWIDAGKLTTQVIDGERFVPLDINHDVVISMLKRKPRRQLEVWAPDDLPHYSSWHDLLDSLVWLLCVVYSSPDSIRKKRPRLDSMLAEYLNRANASPRNVQRAFHGTRKPSRTRSAKDLQRGWYHELSFAYPLRSVSLDLSGNAVTDCLASSADRFAFPTWRIVACYYAAYFFMRSAVTLKTGEFRIQEHQAAISAFKNNLASPLQDSLWQYPLSLAAMREGDKATIRPGLPDQLHLRYAYARHPRDPFRSPDELHECIGRRYRRRLAHSAGDCYGLFDMLRDFRVWANYQDVDNLLKLRSTGYKAYLDRNLSVLLFFVAAVSEVCHIAIVGPNAYVRRLQKFYNAIAGENASLSRAFENSPVVQRLAVYESLGLVSRQLCFRVHANPHKVRLPPEVRERSKASRGSRSTRKATNTPVST